MIVLPFYLKNTNNFGDYMNGWLWPKILGELVNIRDGIRLIGIGSLINAELNHIQGKKIIFGTGSGYGSFPPKRTIDEWCVYFVRGPMTAKNLGLSEKMSIVDGAWLISLVPGFSRIPQKKGVSFIPHWKTAEAGNWAHVCAEIGFRYINPISEFEPIINQIASSELVITESLHGAIFADYFRTPWIPIQITSQFLNYKWYDWCQSIGVPFKVARIPPSDFLDYVIQNKLPNYRDISISVIDSPHCENYQIKDAGNNPGTLYRYKTNIKKILKQVRKSMFSQFQYIRNMPPVNYWNRKYWRLLYKELVSMSHNESFLSSDTVRNEKIERLEEMRNKLVRDYNDGVFFDKHISC